MYGVYLDAEGVGSPNLRHADTFSYVDQAITLNRILLAADLPRLTVATNVADSLNARLSRFDTGVRPARFSVSIVAAIAKGNGILRRALQA